jgi:hypothetical protein
MKRSKRLSADFVLVLYRLKYLQVPEGRRPLLALLIVLTLDIELSYGTTSMSKQYHWIGG